MFLSYSKIVKPLIITTFEQFKVTIKFVVNGN